MGNTIFLHEHQFHCVLKRLDKSNNNLAEVASAVKELNKTIEGIGKHFNGKLFS